VAEHVYVIRPAERVFDTLENRALVWLLERLHSRALRVVPAQMAEAGVHSTDWLERVSRSASALQTARRFAWLRSVEAQVPNQLTSRRLVATRKAFYAEVLVDAIAMFRRYDAPSPEDVTELLCQRYFEPERDWQLFELVVALRLARALASVSSGKRRARLLVGTGRAPYARYLQVDGSETRLWYQSWPVDSGASAHSDARTHYEIRGGPVRPDIVIQKVSSSGNVTDAAILELKATKSASYLSQGLSQLLGYLNDCPASFITQPSGWLVAPRSGSFVSKEADGRSLWAVDADTVAQAAVNRFAA
jgi:hypothetical protein